MGKALEESLIERQRLRKELTIKYRQQADLLQLHGAPSVETTKEIELLRKELAKVDKRSVSKDDDRKQGPKRSSKFKKVAWHCSNPECTVSMPSGTKPVNYRKRNYCSSKCALADAEASQKTMTAKT